MKADPAWNGWPGASRDAECRCAAPEHVNQLDSRLVLTLPFFVDSVACTETYPVHPLAQVDDVWTASPAPLASRTAGPVTDKRGAAACAAVAGNNVIRIAAAPRMEARRN
jgi:hypothetical protein